MFFYRESCKTVAIIDRDQGLHRFKVKIDWEKHQRFSEVRSRSDVSDNESIGPAIGKATRGNYT